MRHNIICLIISIFVLLFIFIPTIYVFFTQDCVFAFVTFLLSSLVLALSVVIFLAIYETVDYFLEELEEKKHK